MSLSRTVSEISLLVFKNLKRLSDPEHIPFGCNLSITHALVLLCNKQHKKFEVHSFTNQKDMIEAN